MTSAPAAAPARAAAASSGRATGARSGSRGGQGDHHRFRLGDREGAAPPPYCAAKGGLGLLTKVMALELAEHGITVNAVAPGEIATLTGPHEQDPGERDRPALPAGRPGDAHEIAEAIAFLARPGARYVNGASLVVDGGLMLTAADFNREAAAS